MARRGRSDDLVDGDDGLPAEKVGVWAKEKHNYLCRYIDISRGARSRYLGAGRAGAPYIELFSGPGRALIRDTNEWIDGSSVAAWKKSVEGGSPFSRVLIADIDQERLSAAEQRLKKLGAPVEVFLGPATETVDRIVNRLDPYGLNFAFLDPYSLGALNLNIIKALARRRRMDVLVHLSKMDLQRNLDGNIGSQISAFDAFAPGWRDIIDVEQAQRGIRIELIDFWKTLVAEVRLDASAEMKLLKGRQQQHLYWLLLLASHKLPHSLWKTAANTEKQGELF